MTYDTSQGAPIAPSCPPTFSCALNSAPIDTALFSCNDISNAITYDTSTAEFTLQVPQSDFSRLTPGTYEFEITATITDSNWMTQTDSFTLTVVLDDLCASDVIMRLKSETTFQDGIDPRITYEVGSAAEKIPY